MSTDSKSSPPLDDEIVKRLIELDIHERDTVTSDLFGASGRISKIPLEILLPEVLAATGQKFILWSLVFLTQFYKILPQSIIKFLNDKLVATLYENMPRNPTDLTGAIIDLPPDQMGRPNHPYARSVLDVSHTLAPDLPSPEDVFDKLLKRSKTEDWDSLKKYAGGLSSLTFAFGTLVIHSVFNSERTPPAINNKTSSYFDLSPLYGDLPSEEKEVRNCELGRGLLHPDCFADARMLFLPPGAATLLVVFNRNHNYIAEQLLKKNERGHWCDPPPHDAAAHAKQDEEIFQTARLINCQHFVNVVITDYVGGVMGMAARGGGWPGNAEALHEINLNGRKVSRGDGNLVSIEFNILYRWHSTLSKMDEEWIEETLGGSLGDHTKPNWNKLPVSEYERGNRNITPTIPVKDRTFAGLKRLPNGHFADADISYLLYRATEESAGFFRARGTPVVMKVVDVMGMMQARAWKACTINELRKWLGLEPFKSFEDWNAYPEIANAARELYGDIDKLELYPGLHGEGHAEDGFEQKYNTLRVSTVRNGLLFDAIALIRGDPGLTTKFTPESVTPWGYADAARDPVTNKSFGGHMHKLLKRNLPHNFPDDNIYTWFPMSTPTFMKSNKNLPPQPDQPWNFERPV